MGCWKIRTRPLSTNGYYASKYVIAVCTEGSIFQVLGLKFAWTQNPKFNMIYTELAHHFYCFDTKVSA